MASVGASYINNYIHYSNGSTSTQEYIVDNLDTTTGALLVPTATSAALTFGGGVISGAAIRTGSSSIAQTFISRVGIGLGVAAAPFELPAALTVGASIGIGVAASWTYNKLSPVIFKPAYKSIVAKANSAYLWGATKYKNWRKK